MDLTQLLNSNVGKDIISGISNQTQTKEQDTASVINAAAPVLMGMLQKNASTPEGAQSLQGALQEHDGNILNNITSFLGSGGNANDGNGILGHILGNNRNTVEKQLSDQTGVALPDVSKILTMLAPILMGFLGQQNRQQQGGNLTDLLGGLMGGGSSSSIGGNILSSILKQAGGGGQSKGGGLGDMLGGIFGKK